MEQLGITRSFIKKALNYKSDTPVIKLEKEGRLIRLQVLGVRYSIDSFNKIVGITTNSNQTELQEANNW